MSLKPITGNVADLILAEMTDKKTTFTVDQTKSLAMTLKFRDYECPVHGNIGPSAAIIFKFDGEDEQTFCMKCIRDKLIEIGIQRVRQL